MQNIGWLDRIVRIGLGVGLLSLVFLNPPVMWGWLGLAALMTGVAGACPLYALCGLSTRA